MGVTQKHNQATVSSGYIRAIYNGALNIGIDKSQLNDIIDHDLKNLEIGTRRFPAEALLEILELAADYTQNPSIGILLGSQIRPERRLDVIYAASFCQNLRQAIELNIEYQPIIQSIGHTRLTLEESVGHCVWYSDFPDRMGVNILKEAIFTSYASIGRWLVWADRLPLVKMTFRHKQPGDIAIYQNIFGPNVEFDGRDDVLVFKRETLDTKIPSQNAEILSRLKPSLDQKLAQINGPENVIYDVKSVISGLIGSKPVRFQDICSRLDMSERTLRRKLNEAGAGFSDILTSVRQEAAGIYLLDENLSLADVAQALGFNDQSAFSRAFKSWTGETPKAFRKRETS